MRQFKSYLMNLLFEKDTPERRFLINQIFPKIIPFNAPHRISILELSNHKSLVKLPYTKRNLNHLKGVHAAAIATAGEFSAGVLLIKNFPISKYRLILSQLNIEYFYQAKTNTFAQASLSSTQIDDVAGNLSENQKTIVILESKITDEKTNHIATVTSHWQLKSWKDVKTRP